jgi:hypothetical protein
MEVATKREKRAIYDKEWRRKHAARLRAYKRDWVREWRKKNGYAAEERAAKKFPEKVVARRMLYNAVRRGETLRGSCEVCEVSKTQGHHDDYSKPLDVRWFCPVHHAEHHKVES